MPQIFAFTLEVQGTGCFSMAFIYILSVKRYGIFKHCSDKQSLLLQNFNLDHSTPPWMDYNPVFGNRKKNVFFTYFESKLNPFLLFTLALS